MNNKECFAERQTEKQLAPLKETLSLTKQKETQDMFQGAESKLFQI